MERFDVTSVPVAVDLDSDGNPIAIVWEDGRRFTIASSGAPVPTPSSSGKFLAANVRDVYIIVNGNRTTRRSLICDEGKWSIIPL